jgi:16S rRNA (guanine527-N7)-methyltransferase
MYIFAANPFVLDLLLPYFPDLTDVQKDKFAQLLPLYKEWNDKINVVSRKDIEQLYLHHVLHSLAIAKFIKFVPGSDVLDLGTGGGFPGIPLAILFPRVQFTLCDSIGKKIRVVEAVSEALGLENVTPVNARAEELKQKFDFVVSRAVTDTETLIKFSRKLLGEKQFNAYPNGLITLKGGDKLREELQNLPKFEYVEKVAVRKYFDNPYYDDKYVVYLQG